MYADGKFQLFEDCSGMHADYRAGGRNLVLPAPESIRVHRGDARQPATQPGRRGFDSSIASWRRCATFRPYSKQP